MVLKTMEFPVDMDYVYDQLPEDHEFQSEKEELRFIAELPYEALLEASKNNEFYDEPNLENSTMYLDHAGFVAETESEEDQSRVVYLAADNILYMISDQTKQAMYMTKSDMDEMKALFEKSKKDTDQLEDYGYQEDEMPKVNLLGTGKSKRVHGFMCKEFISLEEGRYVQIWATEDPFELTDRINEMMGKLETTFNTGSDEEMDGLLYEIPGHINILRTEIHQDFMNGLTYQREEYTAVEKYDVPAQLYEIPSTQEGYVLISYKDLIDQMQKALEEAMDE
jgi:hypothetical protein